MNTNNNDDNMTVQSQPNNPIPPQQQPSTPYGPNRPNTPYRPNTPHQPYPPQPEGQATRLSKKQKPGGSGKKWWLIAMIVLLAGAAIGGGIYFFMNEEKSRPSVYDEEDIDEEDMDEGDMDEEDDTYDMRRDQRNIDEEEEEEEAITQPATNPNVPQTLVLNGDADGYPLTLTLQVNANGRVTGTYKNETAGTTMQLSGTKTGDAFHLTGSANRTTYTFRIRPDGRLYTGTIESGRGNAQELHLTERH